MLFVLATLIEGGRVTAIAIAVTAAAITGLGVIWRKVFRPVVMAAKKSNQAWEWLELQIAPGNGEGSVRDQMNRAEGTLSRLEEQQRLMQERQDIGAEVFRAVVEDVKRHEGQISMNAASIAELRAAIGEMKALLGETVSYARQTKDVVQEVRHEQEEIAAALLADTATTGETPVTP